MTEPEMTNTFDINPSIVLKEGECIYFLGEKYEKAEEHRKPKQVKFVSISRTISDASGIHYLDAIDENGIHWMAQMKTDVEKWITYKEFWYEDPQQPTEIR